MTLNTHFLIQEKSFNPPVFYTEYKNLGITEIDGEYPCQSFNLEVTPEEIIKKVIKNCAAILAQAENPNASQDDYLKRIKELSEISL